MIYDSLSRANRALLSDILSTGVPCSPRGRPTRELRDVVFRVTDPRARLLPTSGRGWSLPLAVGEFLWHLRGAKSLVEMSYYSRQWSSLIGRESDKGGSAYGHKLGIRDERSQWAHAMALLRATPESRRAYMLLGDPAPEHDHTDVACVTMFTLSVRDGRVEASTTLRSSDAFLGLPYDMFVFSCLQEYAASQLGLEVGSYAQYAVSLHVYDNHLPRCRAWLEASEDPVVTMPPLGRDWKQHGAAIEIEARLRRGDRLTGEPDLGPFWLFMVRALQRHAATKFRYECPTWAAEEG